MGFNISYFLYFVLSLAISVSLGPVLIPYLKKLKFGQTIREEGPKSHYIKTGTPTMGGVMFLIAILVSFLISRRFSSNAVFVISALFGFGIIGFIDDFKKIVLKRSLGLRAYEKIILQFIVAIALSVYHTKTSQLGTYINMPFMENNFNMAFLYMPFLLIVFIASTNSVNLTDGLDGLASGVTIIATMSLSLIAMKLGFVDISLIGLIICGGCLGFLYYNKYPAKVFMGDTGSLALGGAFAAMAIRINMPFLIPIVGFIYFLESISVILQVSSFKLFKKRIFKMSPIHHHFELCGWKETKVVLLFYIITLVMSFVGYYSI